MQYKKTTGKIFEDDPNVRIPQKDLVHQIQKEQDQKEIYPSGMGDEKNYKSDPRTPNQRKKDAWAEKIAKKPLPKPTYINGNVIDLHPFIHDPWWLIHEEKPEDEDTSIPIEEKIRRFAQAKQNNTKQVGVASLFRLKKFS